MTWSIDPPVMARGIVCAAITHANATGHQIGQTHVFHGAKRPRLMLLLEGGDVRGFDLQGRVYDATEIENLYPDAIAQLAEVTER